MLIGLCDRTERPFQNQDKGIFRTDKKAACLLYPGGAFRSAAFLFTQRTCRELHGDPVHDDVYAGKCARSPDSSASPGKVIRKIELAKRRIFLANF